MKKLIGILLLASMLICILTANVFAAATDISVVSAAYYASGDLKSTDVRFGWDTASASSRLTVMTERLRSAGEAGTSAYYGDFTDCGYYGTSFRSWEEVVAQKNKFGILYYTDEKYIQADKTNSISLCFDDGDIPMDVDRTYYVYLWTYWGGHYYPDNLFMVLQVKGGQLQYASATDRNSYGKFTVLKEGNLTNTGSPTTPTTPVTPTTPATPTTPTNPGSSSNTGTSSTPGALPGTNVLPDGTIVVTDLSSIPGAPTIPADTAPGTTVVFTVGSKTYSYTVMPDTSGIPSIPKQNNKYVINSPMATYNNLSINDFEWEVIRLCNIERAKEGLNALSTNGTLQVCCDTREKELETTYSHTRPDGTKFSTVFPSDYVKVICGENIAEGQLTPAQVVQEWMESPGHRANIMNPNYGYMGVGYNEKTRSWVQIFADAKPIVAVRTNATQRSLPQSELSKSFITLEASNGYVSFMPADFESMKQEGGKYTPRVDCSSVPVFEKLAEATKPVEEEKPEIVRPDVPVYTPKEGGLFDRFIPIEQVYAALNRGTQSEVKKGEFLMLDLGTRFGEETRYDPDHVKRIDYLGHFLKFNYLGTYGTIDPQIAIYQLNIINKTEYEKLMRGEESGFAKKANLTKDTVVVSIDIYDANKNFVRTLSPACVIYATHEDGTFLTYSGYRNRGAMNFFSRSDIIYPKDEDTVVEFRGMSFVIEDYMLTDPAAVDNLLDEDYVEEKYEFICYPELTGEKRYNTNHILSEEEFVSADMTYYQVTTEFQKIDPVVKYEIKDVVSYSYYVHYLGIGYTQRHIVTADGTLYGISNFYEKKIIASNVKKATANYYLTNDGELVEVKSGKVAATGCLDMAESTNGQIIGFIKNDGCYYYGYTYIEGGSGYARGFSKGIDNPKAVVPNGVIDKNNTLYRFHHKVTASEVDMNAFASGKIEQEWSVELSIVKVCDNVVRVFPYQRLIKVLSYDEQYGNDSIYGFVQTKDGSLYGFGYMYHQQLGTYGKIERIFPGNIVISDGQEGEFVCVKVENEPTPYAIVCRFCDDNKYRWGKMKYLNERNELVECPPYVCETLGGYYATDRKVFGVTATPITSGDQNSMILCEYNISKDLPQMNRGLAIYCTFGLDGKDNIHLLPSVSNWYNDLSSITLIERTDGSMWIAKQMGLSPNANLIAKIGGYLTSNVFMVSGPTTTRRNYNSYGVDEIKFPANTQAAKLQFADVAPSAWYASSVQWAIDRKITAGTSATTFSPDDTCTKAQIITFIYRAVGSPAVSGANPFTDVNATDYYYNSSLWAYNMGMVDGTVFNPHSPCRRSDTVMYLWKNAGKPAASYGGEFSDVNTSAAYSSAVAWAVKNNITSGTGDGMFSPDMTCTRAQIVTFLNRALK